MADLSEKLVIQNSLGKGLYGDFYKASNDDGRIVILSHGFTGDRSEHGTFEPACEELHSKNISSYKFDFRGSGESGDDGFSVTTEIQDLISVIDHFKSEGYSRFGLLGCSMGGLVSLKTYTDYKDIVKSLVLWAPATHPTDPKTMKGLAEKEQFRDKDHVYLSNSKGKLHKVLKETIEHLEDIDQEKLLSDVSVPTLILHGDKDDVVPPDFSKKAMKYLPKDSELDIVPGGEHIMEGQKSYIAKRTADWFKENL